MAIENKVITIPPYYIPLSYHVLKAYTVFPKAEVTLATVESHYSASTAAIPGIQPVQIRGIVINGVPEGDTEDWIYAQLEAPNDGTTRRVANEYEYHVSYEIGDRFMLADPAPEIPDGEEFPE